MSNYCKPEYEFVMFDMVDTIACSCQQVEDGYNECYGGDECTEAGQYFVS